MAYATIDKGSSYFNTVLYTGNGSARSITGVGFKPDWVWVKPRSSVNSHVLADVIRGVTKTLATDLTSAEGTNVNAFTAFGTDGFSLGTGTDVNSNTVTYASWNWLAGGTGVAGDNSSTISANSTAGFSIIKYTGNGVTTASAPAYTTGIGASADLVIYKRLDSTGGWTVQCRSLTLAIGTSYLLLNSTIAQTASGATVGSFGTTIRPRWTDATNGNNINGANYIAYCFASIKGFSKIGSYTGNGSTDGTFVYTGFKPSFVIWKRIDSAGYDWDIYDTARDTYNLAFKEILANATSAESSSTVLALDILSNGFKLRTTNDNGNGSGGTYIYMAFASNPFVSSKGIPTTAR